MARSVRLAPRESVRGFYDASTGQILIVAAGEIGAGVQVDIDEVVPPSTPLAFRLLAVRRPGIWPTIVRPYRVAEFFRVAGDPDRVRVAGQVEVHHADGVDQVELKAMPAELVSAARQPQSSTGYSASLSFDEAFGDAVAGLARDDTPDALLRVTVDEIGGLFGGFAGFHHLFVRIHGVGDAGGGGPIEEIAPERRTEGGVIVEVAPDRPISEVITEVAPEQPYGEGIVEVAPDRPEGDVITEIAPDRPYGEGVVEIAPDRPEGDVITEIAPDRPYGEGVVEVAPDRPEGDVITEIAPDRPEGDVITEVAPDRPDRSGSEVIAEVAPERPKDESADDDH
jgi:hypothetical protein